MGPDVEYLQYLECADKVYFTMKMQLRVNFLSLIGSKQNRFLLRNVQSPFVFLYKSMPIHQIQFII